MGVMLPSCTKFYRVLRLDSEILIIRGNGAKLSLNLLNKIKKVIKTTYEIAT